MYESDPFELTTAQFFGNLWQKLTLAFMLLMLVGLVMIKPIVEKAEKKKEGLIQEAGNVVIEIRWPDTVSVDVDLWIQSPEDPKPIGYSNRGGKFCNLLRDDRGSFGDPLQLNYERVECRGLPAGEFTVNLHLYGSMGTHTEIPVTVVVSIRKEGEDALGPVISRQAVLREYGEELTVTRFEMDTTGYVDPKSVHDLYKPLRAWKAETE